MKNIKSSSTFEILQLDYSGDTGVVSTLQQMIMSLTSSSKADTPIFHCVDMDWKEDGFIFQYSPQLAKEAETTLNTLLPLLKHHFPDADAGSNFTCQAEERCRSMAWDFEKGMIVDTLTLETNAMGDDETLVGFEFDAEVTTELTRPVTNNNFMPGDADSVSTFQSLRSRFTTQLQHQGSANINPTLTVPISNPVSSNSITTSTVTPSMDSTHSAITSLTEQVANQQKQFENLQALLQQLLKPQQTGSSPEGSSNTGGAETRSGSEQ